MDSTDSRKVLAEVKAIANGMLALDVYERLYDIGSKLGSGLFLEVGTAHGAATISLALGAKSAGSDFKIITVDPFGGIFSSRTRYGSVEDNIKIVRNNFVHFDVDSYVTVIAGTSANLIRDERVSGVKFLMVDADGRIDRDLALLFPILSDDATIVLDDIDGAVFSTHINNRPMLDQKHRIANLLVDEFLKSGILREPERLGDTGFYKKGVARPEEIERLSLSAYRELVFSEMPPATLSQFIKRKFPSLASSYRTLKLKLTGI
jgi:predicted O-methyltransferase YrrM